MTISKWDVTKYGVTPNCKGCDAANRGGTTRNHTEECRKRLEERMKEDGDERTEKMNEEMAKMIEGDKERKRNSQFEEGNGVVGHRQKNPQKK